MLGDGIVSFGVAVVTVSLQERERVGEDRLLEPDRPVDPQRGRGELDRPCVVAELARACVSSAWRDAAELVDEVHVPGGAAELPVGGRLQADLLLHPHDLADRRRPRRRAAPRRDPAGREVGSGPRAARAGRSRLPTWSARNGGWSRGSWRREPAPARGTDRRRASSRSTPVLTVRAAAAAKHGRGDRRPGQRSPTSSAAKRSGAISSRACAATPAAAPTAMASVGETVRRTRPPPARRARRRGRSPGRSARPGSRSRG